MLNSERIDHFLFREESQSDTENGIIRNIQREPKRTSKCRLILSVERTTFQNKENAAKWDYCSFNFRNGFIYKKEGNELKFLERWKLTDYQFTILMEFYHNVIDPEFNTPNWKRTDIREIIQFLILRIFHKNIKGPQTCTISKGMIPLVLRAVKF